MAIVEIDGGKRISGMGKVLGVSGNGDLQNFFEASNKNKLWYFNNFTTKFPNGKWMKYKPQKITDVPVGPPTDAKRKSGLWGFTNIPQWTTMENMAYWCSDNSSLKQSNRAPACGNLAFNEYWKYVDPTQWAATDYRRSEDFEGAWSLAECPISELSSVDELIPFQPNSTVTIQYLYSERMMTSGRDYNLQFADFYGPNGVYTGDAYFGVCFIRIPQGQSTPVYWSVTQTTPIARYETETFAPYITIPNASYLQTTLNYGWRIFPFLSLGPEPLSMAQGNRTGTFVWLPHGTDGLFSDYREIGADPGVGSIQILSFGGQGSTQYNRKISYLTSNFPTYNQDVVYQTTWRYEFGAHRGPLITQGWTQIPAGLSINGRTDDADTPSIDYPQQWDYLETISVTIACPFGGQASTIYYVQQVNP